LKLLTILVKKTVLLLHIVLNSMFIIVSYRARVNAFSRFFWVVVVKMMIFW